MGFVTTIQQQPDRPTLIPHSEHYLQLWFGKKSKKEFCIDYSGTLFGTERAASIPVEWGQLDTDPKNETVNSTQKPLTLIKSFLMADKQCDLVWDLFSGSGTTSVAAVELGK